MILVILSEAKDPVKSCLRLFHLERGHWNAVVNLRKRSVVHSLSITSKFKTCYHGVRKHPLNEDLVWQSAA